MAVGGRGVAGAGGRRAAASGFKREVTINMLLGGACGKARGWGASRSATVAFFARMDV